MLVSQLTEAELTDDIIDRLLYAGLVDTGETADCIIVLGSIKASKYRVPVAVNAFRKKRSDRIMLCGGALRTFPDGIRTESEDMYNKALSLGIPDESILLENSSQNTIENILFSLIELQRTFHLNNIRTILLVTTAYHMRRSLAIARYLFPSHITIIPCPADATTTNRNNWMNSPEGIERAKKEALNIINYIQNGVFPDFEI